MDEVITVQFDGGSRGNPGPAGIGVVLSAADGTPLVTLGRFIGRATNNAAEYAALITGLQEAKKLGAKRVAVRGDSELIVRQMRGEYKVRNADLRPLYEQAQALLREFEQATIQHNYRHNNALADRLANLAMDRKADVRDVDAASSAGAPASPLDEPSPVAPKVGDRFACPRCGCVVRLEKPSSIRPHQLKPFVCQCGAKMSAI
jgi:ribonuclease HI